MSVIGGVLFALIGGFLQVRRRPDRVAADVHMVWWMVLVVGVSSISGAMYHIVYGQQTADLIGYTRGDGGFQWENAMGDLAIGVAGLMAYRFRGHFWLAIIVVLTVAYYGDAAGHLYFWLADGNTRPYNVGAPLVADIVVPVVMWALYVASRRRGGDAIGATPMTPPPV